MTIEAGPIQTDLYTSGTLGYHTFRIPSLVVTTRGTLLAIAEGRRNSQHDTGDIDLVLRRSRDNGHTFDDLRVAVAGGGNVAGNPAPVVDASTGRIWLWFCRNNADGPETLICAGKAPRTVWLTSSDDDGQTWAEPKEMTADVKLPEWTWYGTGPGHALQLASGRLLIPSYHVIGQNFDRATDPYISHAILSDDHGQTWRLGGAAQPGTNECMAAQLADGRVYLNERNYLGENRRAFAMSHDEGESFDAFGWHDELIDPICQAAVLSAGGDRLIFSNAASRARERLTLRTSANGGQTWSRGQVLRDGRAAYSDLCELPDGTLGCLYEAGSVGEYEHLRWARFSRAWIGLP